MGALSTIKCFTTLQRVAWEERVKLHRLLIQFDMHVDINVFCYKRTMDKHHFRALLKDQVCDATVCKCDSHQVFGFKAEHLYDVKKKKKKKKCVLHIKSGPNYEQTLGHLCSALRKRIIE